ncbi:MAG TPA: homoserine O-succinyltransferase, partial [Acidimicrobiales bacterium]|nr:homoserine O-succinyltransferase [Acidimicrobiales bacterium]
PLTEGVSELSIPHSRFNEVPEADVVAAGYQVLVRGEGCGWTVAAARRGQCQIMLFQGHPEYGRLTLLREYRRDVRRYLLGTQGSYPNIPPGYLDHAAQDMLTAFRRKVTDGEFSTTTMSRFPYELVARGVMADWCSPARRLMSNWVRQVRVKLELTEGAPEPTSSQVVDVDAGYGLAPTDAASRQTAALTRSDQRVFE